MIRAVLDCGVLVSAIGWGGHARACLDLAACGQASLFVTDEIWNEYAHRIPPILAAEKRDVDPQPVLAWLLTAAQLLSRRHWGNRAAVTFGMPLIWPVRCKRARKSSSATTATCWCWANRLASPF